MNDKTKKQSFNDYCNNLPELQKRHWAKYKVMHEKLQDHRQKKKKVNFRANKKTKEDSVALQEPAINKGFGKYILETDNSITRIEDVIEWGYRFQQSERQVANTELCYNNQNIIRISTVFIGLDHSYTNGPPIVFETMVFSDEETINTERIQERCSTYEQALAMHIKIVKYVKSQMNKRIKHTKLWKLKLSFRDILSKELTTFPIEQKREKLFAKSQQA